jgi:Kdo2-lipid IVA lauroyltransferase/acyltransferase
MKHRIEYLAVRAAAAAVKPFSMARVRGWGAALGRLAYRVDKRHRRVALGNLAAAFPGRSMAERESIARGVFEHFGGVILELLKVATMKPDELLALCETEGDEHCWKALEPGKGVLCFTGHFGYWEVQAIASAAKFMPFSVLARPLDNPQLHQMLERIRTMTGNQVIYRHGAIRKILRELALNRGVAMLIDQHLQRDAILVDFFNRPAATTSALAVLALRTGAAVLPVFALPLPGGRYKLMYESPVPPPREDSPDAIREFTQRCTDVLEMYVRRHPELWLWMHRRWRDDEDRGGRA